MKFNELPPRYQFFTLEMRSDVKKQEIINGVNKMNIEQSKSSFITLPSGDTIHKSSIIGIWRNQAETMDRLRLLPPSEMKSLKSMDTNTSLATI